MKDPWFNLGYDGNELQPYIEPEQILDEKRIGRVYDLFIVQHLLMYLIDIYICVKKYTCKRSRDKIQYTPAKGVKSDTIATCKDCEIWYTNLPVKGVKSGALCEKSKI